MNPDWRAHTHTHSSLVALTLNLAAQVRRCGTGELAPQHASARCWTRNLKRIQGAHDVFIMRAAQRPSIKTLLLLGRNATCCYEEAQKLATKLVRNTKQKFVVRLVAAAAASPVARGFRRAKVDISVD